MSLPQKDLGHCSCCSHLADIGRKLRGQVHMGLEGWGTWAIPLEPWCLQNSLQWLLKPGSHGSQGSGLSSGTLATTSCKGKSTHNLAFSVPLNHDSPHSSHPFWTDKSPLSSWDTQHTTLVFWCKFSSHYLPSTPALSLKPVCSSQWFQYPSISSTALLLLRYNVFLYRW